MPGPRRHPRAGAGDRPADRHPADLQGPKIRVGTSRAAGSSGAGETVRFVLEGSEGDESAIPLPHPEIFAAVAAGQDLLIDDGQVRLQVVALSADTIDTEVVVGGHLQPQGRQPARRSSTSRR